MSFHLLCENIKIKVYIIITSPVHLYGCETWSVTLGEQHGLRVSKEGQGYWGLETEELNFCNPCLIVMKERRMRWVGKWHV